MPRPFLLSLINAHVSANFGEGKVRNRRASSVLSRQVGMYLARRAGFSSPQIGKFYGRHHTAVLYGVRRIDERRKNDKDLDVLLSSIAEDIRQDPDATEATIRRNVSVVKLIREVQKKEREMDNLKAKLESYGSMQSTLDRIKHQVESLNGLSPLECVAAIRSVREILSQETNGSSGRH